MGIDPAVLARQRGMVAVAPAEDHDDLEVPRIGAMKPGPVRLALRRNKYAKYRMGLYFPGDTANEIRAEAVRLQRSESWVLRYAWKHGKAALAKFPTIDEPQD